MLLTVVSHNLQRISISASVDSSSEQNLISKDLVDCLAISTQTLQQPLSVTGLTGESFAKVQFKTHKIHLMISGNHHDHGEFLFLNLPHN